MDFDLAKVPFDIVDQRTRVLKPLTSDWSTPNYQQREPGLFRLHYGRDEKPGFAQNDWLVTRAGGGSAIAHLDGCQNCTLQNITFQNGGFATIFETGGAGGNHILRCKIQPGPRPGGATEDQLVGCGADGVHSVDVAVGPEFQDCIFSGVFLDDCIAIHGNFDRVIRAAGNTIVLAAGRDKPAVGDPIRISNTDNFFAQAICTAVEELPNHDLKLTLDKDLNVPINHAQDADPKLGTKANDPNHCGKGYKIIRCRLGNTRSRGILVKADDGLIDHCTIEGCGMSGVSIGPEFWWNEANYAWNVTVSNNTFRHCNQNNGDQACIWIHGDGAIGNRNVSLQNNRFESCYGESIVRIEDAEKIEMSGNTFADSFPAKLPRPGNIMVANRAKGIKLAGNIVSDPGNNAGQLVELGKGVDAGEVQNNNGTGISLSR
jgi:hypothetical protein